MLRGAGGAEVWEQGEGEGAGLWLEGEGGLLLQDREGPERGFRKVGG
jgi:hypothetical protein